MPAPNNSLHAAAEDGDIDALNRFLMGGESVDARDPEGRTPLMYAIHGGQSAAIRHLLKWGAAVDAQTLQGGTALRHAAGMGQADTVRLLLARGADPNQVVHPQAQPISLKSARELATSLNKFQAMLGRMLPGIGKDDSQQTPEAMVADSQKPREPVRSGFRTLMSAIRSGSVETVTALLEAGVDREAPESESLATSRHKGMSPLGFAAGQSSLAMVRALVEHGFSVSTLDDGDTSPLMGAIIHGKGDVVRFLLEAGADPDAGTMPPLQFAITMDNLEMAELLLEHGAQTISGKHGIPMSLMAQDKPEMLALLERFQGTDWHRAVKAGDLAAVRARLDAGAPIDACDKPGETALYFAAENDRREVVPLLLARGANPNVATKFGVTPLMCAVGKGFTEVARELIAGGADVDAANHWGQSALYRVWGDDKREIRELLLASGARVGLVEAAFLGDREQVSSFLNAGTPVDAPNEGGMTALMAVASHGDQELASLLHDAWGANPSARDARGNTPLAYAARAHTETDTQIGDGTELMRLLLDWGASVDSEGDDGSSPIQGAIQSGKLARVRLLAERGADLNRYHYYGKDHKIGTTPLYHAIHAAALHEQGPDIVRLLLERGANADLPQTFEGEPHETPLMMACKQWEIVEKLSGEYPAIKRERLISVVRLLLDHGADVNAKGRSGTGSVLLSAIATGRIEIVRMILDAGVRLDRDTGASALLAAAENPEITALLRKRGASEIASDGTELLPPGLLQKKAKRSPSSPFSLPNFAEMRSQMAARQRQRWSGSGAGTGSG